MKNKKGQVTIFIIIGIVIVVTALVLFMFKPKITSTTLKLNTENPSAFISSCMEEKIDETLNQLYSNGGDMDPEPYIIYDEEKITYLCYTNEYEKPCVNQQPLLESHIKKEIYSEIKSSLDACFDDLVLAYEKKGYATELKSGNLIIQIIPEEILFDLVDYKITITDKETKSYDSFSFSKKDNLFSVLSMVTNIIKEEIEFGDIQTMDYMRIFRNFDVEKKQIYNGITLYTIRNQKNQAEFKFASRSQVPIYDY